MLMEIKAEKIEGGEEKTFFLDNTTGEISEQPFAPSVPPPFHWENKQRLIRRVRIQLGLKCNYHCSYCQQAESTKTVPQAHLSEMDGFVSRLLSSVDLVPNAMIDFWGGEPFVYWAYIEKLAGILRKRRPDLQLFVITNGSLLTKERVDFLASHNFRLGVSHDGPGQHLRGDDPFDTHKEVFDYALKKLGNRMAFSVMMNKQNTSRLRIIEWFEERFPGVEVQLQELGFISAVDDASYKGIVDFTPAEFFKLRQDLWTELRFVSKVRQHAGMQNMGCNSLRVYGGPQQASRMPSFRCDAGARDAIAVDLQGNLLTCHNVSAADEAPNGESHNYGTLEGIEDSKINTAKHWTERLECLSCPVLSMCKGSCMFLDGEGFKRTCDTEFTDFITQFAVGFEQVTGFVPTELLVAGLPLTRRDVWGTLYQHEEPKRHKVIPITPISDTI